MSRIPGEEGALGPLEAPAPHQGGVGVGPGSMQLGRRGGPGGRVVGEGGVQRQGTGFGGTRRQELGSCEAREPLGMPQASPNAATRGPGPGSVPSASSEKFPLAQPRHLSRQRTGLSLLSEAGGPQTLGGTGSQDTNSGGLSCGPEAQLSYHWPQGAANPAGPVKEPADQGPGGAAGVDPEGPTEGVALLNDTDAVLSGEELRAVDDSVIQELFQKTKAAKEQQDNYKNAFFFLLFAALYFAILYLQAGSTSSYRVAVAHQQLIPQGFQRNQENSFSGPSDFYQWLNDSIIQVLWQDPYCGDGVCSRPLEFPAFGNFGCAMDCNNFPNVTTVVVAMETNFEREEDMQASSWNLCMTRPVDLCWYSSPQPFTELKGGFSLQAQLVDGDWAVVVTAPNGGVGGALMAPVAGEESSWWLGMDQMQELVQWGGCLPGDQSPYFQCRQTCGDVVVCLWAACVPQPAQAALSGLFVDCLHYCDVDPTTILAFQGQACPSMYGNVSSMFNCSLASSSDTDTWQGPAQVPQPTTAPLPGGAAGLSPWSGLWTSLGSTHSQRMFNAKVAINRVLFTARKDRCLVDHAKDLTAEMADSLAAVLCTLLGGSPTLPGCNYQGAASLEQLWQLMREAHLGAGHSISQQHQERFVALLVSALRSTASISGTDADGISAAMHYLDSAVVDAANPGCGVGGPVLRWGTGDYLNTTIFAGQYLTWMWDDDQPHSIKGSKGAPAGLFRGFGTDRFVLSRLSECTPELIGLGDADTEPTPCALRASWDPPGVFTLTQGFDTPGTFFYGGGRIGNINIGQLNVLPASQNPLGVIKDSLDTECSPGCRYVMLSQGLCDAACNVPQCAFDGGDCSCASPGLDFPFCACPDGQARSEAGVCCESSAQGSNLLFPFQLSTFGGSFTQSDSPLIGTSVPLERTVAYKNRVVIGLLILQQRVQNVSCNSSQLNGLATCSGEPTRSNFGVNPHFLPSSSLFNPDSLRQLEDVDNSTFAADLQYNPENLPYGFIWQDSFDDTVLEGFPIVFDINLNNQGATNRLQYLVDGLFLDDSTSKIDVYLVTYNGDTVSFTVASVGVDVTAGGKYKASYSVDTVHVQNYSWSASNIARFVLELVFLCAIVWNVLEEVLQCIRVKFETGRAVNYLKDPWNWIDLTSLAIQIAGVGLWIHLNLSCQSTYAIQPRYNIYFSLLEFPRYWAMPAPPTGFLEATTAVANLRDIMALRDLYFALQGINVFLVTLRLLKLLDFQPYLGIITRSIAVAAPALLHFLLVWFCVFMSFALYAFLVFGSSIEEFSTLWRSFLTCFLVMMNDNSVEYNFIYMEGWAYAAAIVWWFSFVGIVVYVLLNFLIAIVVEAFMDIKEGETDPTTIAQDVGAMWRRAQGRLAGSYWRYDSLLSHLYSLGADDFRKAEAGSMRRGSFIRDLKGFNLLGALKRNFTPKPQTKRVLKVNQGERCLDPANLQTVMHRAHDRSVAAGGESQSKRSGRISQRLQMVASAVPPVSRSRWEPRSDRQLDLLSDTLMGMFGEEVEAHCLTAHPHLPPRKGNELKEIKARLEAVQADTAAAFHELREMILELKNQGRWDDWPKVASKPSEADKNLGTQEQTEDCNRKAT